MKRGYRSLSILKPMWTEQVNHVYHKLHPLLDLFSLIQPYNKSFHVDGSFGDVYMQLSLLKEYSAQDSEFAIFISKAYLELAKQALGATSKLLPIDSSWLRSFLMQHGILSEVPGLPRPLLLTLYPVLPDLIRLGHLSPIVAYKTILNIEPSSELESPMPIETQTLRPEGVEILKKYNLTPGRTVVICPFNNTWTEIEPKFWSSLIPAVKSIGYDVCINTAGRSELLSEKGFTDHSVKLINVPAHLVVTFTKACGYFITGLNGFSTIQWLFNDETYGLILINSFDGQCAISKNSDSIVHKSLFHRDKYGFRENDKIKELLFNPVESSVILQEILRGIKCRG